MKAGEKSISPEFSDSKIQGVEDEDEDEEVDVPEEWIGEECKRIGLSREDDVIKKLVDPKLPSKEDVELHYLRGHLPFRNWCPI